MGKEIISTIQRGINKQTNSHLHPPQFFLLIQKQIRKKINKEGDKKKRWKGKGAILS